ncbi:hypothetical protein AB3M83_01240 [Microbacterium sp. 179-B 1A2 NHS]|uniref:hypothetical protein n=1 Tax=Microbacterium sp. 179-B 1A2 NHS TaxID=3142383 RepID=UPI0039A0F533
MGHEPLDLRSGRIIAVDTATLRHAAASFDDIVDECGRLRASIADAAADLYGSASAVTVQDLIRRAERIGARAADLAGGLRETAIIYEIIELDAQRAAAVSAGDARAAADLTGRLDRLAGTAPDQAALAEMLVARAPDPHGALVGQLILGTLPLSGLGALPGIVAPLILGAGIGTLTAVKDAGLGVVGHDSRLRSRVPPPRLTLLAATPGSAPRSVAEIARRIPSGGAGSIRVERYAMADGGKRFALYLTGTRSIGGPGAFDMESNAQLYLRRGSESYEAARIALQRAGARPGDAVLVSGHSQGAMVGSRLALEGEFDVPALVGFGNPIQADLGAQTLQVDLRHSDDPVAALAAGGHATTIGAPGSVVAERTVDPLPSLGDLSATVHHLDAYIASAEMLDASADPRMDAVRERIGELADAASVDVFVFDAESAGAVRDDLAQRHGPAG